MAMIPAMSAADFGTGGTAVMNYGMQIGKDLAAYGEKIGLQIKDNRDKQQAMGSLPALQEAMQAFQAGQSGAGYSSIINLAAQDPSNPYVQNLVKLGMMGGTAIDENRYRMRMAEAATARASGTATEFTPDIDPQEAARRVLLGDNARPRDTQREETITIDGENGTSTVDFSKPPTEIPNNAAAIDAANANNLPTDQGQRLETPASPQKLPDIKPFLETAKSPAFIAALKSASKSKPSQEKLSEYGKYVEQYNQQPEEQKEAIKTGLSIVFPSYKDYEKGSKNISPNFIPLSKEQTDVIGDNITGLVLSPSVEAKGTSISSGESKSGGRQSQSVTFGTDKEALEKYQANFTGAASELSEGEIGKFLKKNGGVFNTTYSAAPRKEIIIEDEDPTKIPEKVVLYNKNSDLNDPRTEKIELTKAQLLAYRIIKDSPAEMQRLRSRNSESSYVRIAAAGPTKETSKGLPAIRTGQRKPINTIFGQ
jgi:hypothetical protein